MFELKAGAVIPVGAAYANAVITNVRKNGWCRGYYPKNVKNGNIKAAMFSARAHWLMGDVEYKIVSN